jgi:hypothetical protein
VSGQATVTVVGIAAKGFKGARLGERTDVWITSGALSRFASAPRPSQGWPFLVIARLRDGVAIEEAETLLDKGITNSRGIVQPTRYAHVLRPLPTAYGGPSSKTASVGEQPMLHLGMGTALLLLFQGLVTVVVAGLVERERSSLASAIRIALGEPRALGMRRRCGDFAVGLGLGVLGAYVLASVILAVVPATDLPGEIDLGRLDLAIDLRVVAIGVVAATVLGLGGLVIAAIPNRRGLDLGSRDLYAARYAKSAAHRRALSIHVGVTVFVFSGCCFFLASLVAAVRQGPGFAADTVAFVEYPGAPAYRGVGQEGVK